MRYTKTALLIFGAGILLGLAVVAAELAGIEWVASGVMALGLVLLPVGLVADGRAAALLRFRRRGTARRAARRQRRRRSPARSARRARR